MATTDKKAPDVVDALAGCALALAAVPFLIALRAWTLSVLWAWFAVPLGCPPIGVAHAAGLVGVLGFLFFNPVRPTKDKPDGIGAVAWVALMLGAHVGVAALALSVGWVLQRCM